ncbi:amino acid ABC transporter permease [Bhargavaea beijingensis]|uniref:Amino acid ABC transporter membrane protein 2, PAAT family (TC 3.A.1.3.-) n=1 Tax=Bhargavaea beijingensis TaxID=426756 RepID=A0A1G7B1C9_9BACL|nr:amino acid ABC transporter permease [Bhargavaea beijingensis]MCW1928303.1 amino acid ABC transporter permease [Bhargavaea beijingensis]SDE20928.1 amino acid ABC transporter membrane protein 2, PAAT family (TC 3.A.1.3.-) [Bhargavaea beijingensis]
MQQGLNIHFMIDTFFVALSGVPVTLFVTAVALLIAIPAGFLLALSRVNEIPVIRQITMVYVSFVRGTPIIVQIFITYASVPLILTALFEKYGIQANIYDIHPIWYAFIVFSFSTTAILSEVFRSSLGTVDRGQLEAAQSVGLTSFQAFRRILIPQALVSALPNLATATVNLIKATSLGYAMSLQEITLKAKVAANAGYHYIEAYIDIFLVYLILCSLVEFAFKWYERRASRYKVHHA